MSYSFLFTFGTIVVFDLFVVYEKLATYKIRYKWPVFSLFLLAVVIGGYLLREGDLSVDAEKSLFMVFYFTLTLIPPINLFVLLRHWDLGAQAGKARRLLYVIVSGIVCCISMVYLVSGIAVYGVYGFSL